jgi:hypothetical protein
MASLITAVDSGMRQDAEAVCKARRSREELQGLEPFLQMGATGYESVLRMYAGNIVLVRVDAAGAAVIPRMTFDATEADELPEEDADETASD